MHPTVYMRISGVVGALAVGLGAAGAHGTVHDVLISAGRLGLWQTAVLYHLVHAAALLALGLAAPRSIGLAWTLLLAGILLFSGSLYFQAWTGTSLGVITPIGGLALIAGWLALAIRPPALLPR